MSTFTAQVVLADARDAARELRQFLNKPGVDRMLVNGLHSENNGRPTTADNFPQALDPYVAHAPELSPHITSLKWSVIVMRDNQAQVLRLVTLYLHMRKYAEAEGLNGADIWRDMHTTHFGKWAWRNEAQLQAFHRVFLNATNALGVRDMVAGAPLPAWMAAKKKGDLVETKDAIESAAGIGYDHMLSFVQRRYLPTSWWDASSAEEDDDDSEFASSTFNEDPTRCIVFYSPNAAVGQAPVLKLYAPTTALKKTAPMRVLQKLLPTIASIADTQSFAQVDQSLVDQLQDLGVRRAAVIALTNQSELADTIYNKRELDVTDWPVLDDIVDAIWRRVGKQVLIGVYNASSKSWTKTPVFSAREAHRIMRQIFNSYHMITRVALTSDIL